MGTEHHAFQVRPDAWSLIPNLAKQFDEPFADSSALPTWLVSEETRKHVTVALTGDAGDELFGGYDRYRAVALTAMLDRWPVGARGVLAGPVARAIPASSRAKTRLRKVRRLLEGLAETPEVRYARWMTMFDEPSRLALYSDGFAERLASAGGDDPASLLHAALGVAATRDPATRAMVADLLMYLPNDLLAKVDQSSMAHSLECRGPFLDHRVVELALAMPVERKLHWRGGRSKVVLKEAFAELLPPAIRDAAEDGVWDTDRPLVSRELKDELRAVLLDPVALGRGLFREYAVSRLVEEHISGAKDHAYRLWGLLMLELWFRNMGDGGSGDGGWVKASPLKVRASRQAWGLGPGKASGMSSGPGRWEQEVQRWAARRFPDLGRVPMRHSRWGRRRSEAVRRLSAARELGSARRGVGCGREGMSRGFREASLQSVHPHFESGEPVLDRVASLDARGWGSTGGRGHPDFDRGFGLGSWGSAAFGLPLQHGDQPVELVLN